MKMFRFFAWILICDSAACLNIVFLVSRFHLFKKSSLISVSLRSFFDGRRQRWLRRRKMKHSSKANTQQIKGVPMFLWHFCSSHMWIALYSASSITLSFRCCRCHSSLVARRAVQSSANKVRQHMKDNHRKNMCWNEMKRKRGKERARKRERDEKEEKWCRCAQLTKLLFSLENMHAEHRTLWKTMTLLTCFYSSLSAFRRSLRRWSVMSCITSANQIKFLRLRFCVPLITASQSQREVRQNGSRSF